MFPRLVLVGFRGIADAVEVLNLTMCDFGLTRGVVTLEPDEQQSTLDFGCGGQGHNASHWPGSKALVSRARGLND